MRTAVVKEARVGALSEMDIDVKIGSRQRSSGVEQTFHKRRVVGSNPTVGT